MKYLPESVSDNDSNPYRSPTAIDNANSPAHLSRESALLRFRIAVSFLLVAAIVNDYFLPRQHYVGGTRVFVTYRIRPLSAIFIGAVGLFVLTSTFAILERLAKLLHRTLAPRSDLAAWNAAIYNAFRHAIGLGLAGALLWIIWVIAFFELKVNFYVISYAVGIPAHLLAAGVYVPLIYGWIKAARAVPKKTMNRKS